MPVQPSKISFDAGVELQRMIEQRAEQEGIGVSAYIREAIMLEMLFSGDLEATKFVLQKTGKRIKSALIDRLAGVDVKETVEALAAD